jgi:Ser/Thr protein kinase RdoA (MazF antagonist)
MQLEIAQSTPTAASISLLVQQQYDLGEVIESEFLRRSFNQVYRLSFAGGQRVVARLCAERSRGGPNILFEAAALEHWAQAGCPVARCLPAANGEVSIQAQLPEGSRTLMLFEHLDGEFSSDAGEDVELFARGLAALHIAGESYQGPASAYTLDLDYLLVRPLERLLRASTMTAELRPTFEALGRSLYDNILEMGKLTRVLCQGDAHGTNHFMAQDTEGQRKAVFFDFDELGPGYLGYELAVYPWNLYPREPDGVPSEKPKTKWSNFISAYRETKPVADADLASIARFMAVRQFWFFGEYAGRIPVWGSQTMPTAYLRRQIDMLRNWEALELPL